MTRLKSLLIALAFAAAALITTSAVHHLGEARANAHRAAAYRNH